MIRITGGRFRGRSIESPPRTKDIRPTTSLMRESIFNRLQAQVPGCRFLDLFAGSGIMGIEAISRGADFVLAIDQDPRQCQLIRKNYAGLKVAEAQAKVVPCDVVGLMSKPCREAPFDVIFLDPPYGFTGLETLVAQILANGWLASDGVVMVEHGTREPDLPGFERRLFGESSLSTRLA